MRPQNPFLILFFLALFFSVYKLGAQELTKEELDEQRELFVRAEQALKKNDSKNYERLVKKLESYPLFPYLLYEQLKIKIQTNKPSENYLNQIKKFETKFPDFPFNNQLRSQWLLSVAKAKQWELYIKGYQPTQNAELQCYHLYANYQLSNDLSYLEQAKPLWVVGYEQPDACHQLFEIWQKNKKINKKLVWEKIKNALDSKNFTLIKSLNKYLTKEERVFLEHWEKMLKTPHLLLNKSFLNNLIASEKNKTEALYQSLRLLARRDAEKTLTWLKTYQTHFHFSSPQLEQLNRDIGMYLSHQRSAIAKSFLAELPPEVLDIPTLEWRIRLAISIKDWKDALLWIGQLPPNLKEDKSWQYWHARALEALQQPGSHEIYQNLAKTRSYYGFLSAYRLKQPVALQEKPLDVDPTLIKTILEKPSIQRFQQLQILNRSALARIEWFRTIDKMDEKEIAASAKLAQIMDLHDIAILTIAKTPNFKDDLGLRFPLSHKEEIMANANINNIDPAWIFAIVRQESAFFNEAISPAGARGLMQIMPSTAQILSANSNLLDSDNALYQPNINLQIGSLYLKNLKERMRNNLILATASYNAGPEHILRWLPNEFQEADIWIESIPFKETREYVKNVLVFFGIYRQKLGQPTGLEWILKPIPPKNL